MQVTGKAFAEPHVLLIAQWRPPARRFVVEVRMLLRSLLRQGAGPLFAAPASMALGDEDYYS